VSAATDSDGHDVISPESLGPLLRTAWLGRRQIHLGTCESTNDRAAAEGRAGEEEGLVVTTDAQTAGRGRLGRAWHSPPGENLAFSILLRPSRPPAEIPPLTLLAGAAVAAALRTLGFDARVKWPNDVLLYGHGAPGDNCPATDAASPPEISPGEHPRKVAGILTEAASVGERIGQVVVGIGLNVNARRFPRELSDKATSLRLVRGARLSRAEVLAAVLGAFERAYERFQVLGPAAAVAAWNEHADRQLRGRVRIGERDVEGVTDGVMPDGSLRLRADDGTVHRIVSGEIVTKV
jgi:BirA family biotin operon repressor/biotin-[acetyl-CoA-carboxylase] ligase